MTQNYEHYLNFIYKLDCFAFARNDEDSVSVVKKRESVSEMVDLYSNDEDSISVAQKTNLQTNMKQSNFLCDAPQLVIASPKDEAIQSL